jgi:hypothetical protein
LITKYFIKKRIARAIGARRIVNLTDFAEAKSIALVSTMLKAPDYEQAAEEIMKLVPNVAKTFFCFTGPKVILPEEIPAGKMNRITKKDFNFIGIPKFAFTKYLKSNQFDILINFDSTDQLMSHYLSAEIPATLKVGMTSGEYSGIYDLTLRLPDNQTVGEYFGHLNFYLKALKGKTNEK